MGRGGYRGATRGAMLLTNFPLQSDCGKAENQKALGWDVGVVRAGEDGD